MDLLEGLVAKRRTGTLYINSDDRHVVTFALDRGRISGVYHGPKRGRKALDSIAGLGGGTYHFEQVEQMSLPSQDIPATEELIEQIRTGLRAAPAGPEGGGTPASPAHIDRFRTELRQLLTSYVGPIAGMVVDDCCREADSSSTNAVQAHTIIGKLSEEIADQSEARRFEQEARVLAKRLLSG